jgi:hypothetical protein
VEIEAVGCDTAIAQNAVGVINLNADAISWTADED